MTSIDHLGYDRLATARGLVKQAIDHTRPLIATNLAAELGAGGALDVDKLASALVYIIEHLEARDTDKQPTPVAPTSPSFKGLFEHVLAPPPAPAEPVAVDGTALVERLAMAIYTAYCDNYHINNNWLNETDTLVENFRMESRAALVHLRLQGWSPAPTAPAADVAHALNRIDAVALDEHAENAEMGKLLRAMPNNHTLDHSYGKWCVLGQGNSPVTIWHSTPLAALRAMVEKLAKG